MIVDHMLLAKRDPHEVARARAFIRRVIAKVSVGVLTFEHEPDGSCCRVEPRETTVQWIYETRHEVTK